MRSRAGFFFKQFGLVREQVMSSPFEEDYEHRIPTTTIGYNMRLYETEDRIPGGKGDDTPVSSLLPTEVHAGVEIEKEHDKMEAQLDE